MKPIQAANPFKATGLTKKRVMTRPKVGPYVNIGTGEMLEVQPLSRVVEVDNDPVPFVKLFSDALHILPRLSKPSMTLFCLIAGSLKPNKDTVILLREQVVLHYPSLRGQGWYRALHQLTQLGVIRNKEGSEYWINPNVMFNGRRTLPAPKT